MLKKIQTLLLSILLLTSCGFHLRGPTTLAKPLQTMYFQSQDPYSAFARNLKQYLKMSGVHLAASPQGAATTLSILQEATSQDLLSINSSQQTRQYNLKLTVAFEVLDSRGKVIVAPQMLTETRTLTLQSNQVLAGSNQAALLFHDMRRSIVYNMMNRLASKDVTRAVTGAPARS
jgi:LPS-assembly lipoprotein